MTYNRPPTTSPASPSQPIAAGSSPTIAPDTRPSRTYTEASSHFGASIQRSLNTTPPSAPAHTTIRIVFASVPCSAIRATGVYVPAIITKIIEWSSRLIHRRDDGRVDRRRHARPPVGGREDQRYAAGQRYEERILMRDTAQLGLHRGGTLQRCG